MGQGYVPIPPPPPPPMATPKSWFSQNWKWFAPTVILVPVLLLVLLGGGIMFFVSGAMKSSEPYHYALAAAEHNPQIERELGSPVEPGWFLTGNISVAGSSGDADIVIPLKGKLRHGTLHVAAKKSNDIWTYQEMEVSIDGDPSPIPLLSSSGSPQDKD